MRPISLLAALFTIVFPSFLLAVPDSDTTNEVLAERSEVQGRWRPATIFKVNSLDDRSDGSCDVVHCSLREAIAAANLSKGPDRIEFALPEGKERAIKLLAPLPAADEAVWIDGTTAKGGLVELDGQEAGQETAGLMIAASWSRVEGLHIHGFAGDALVLRGDLTEVEGNILGAAKAGDRGNGGAGLRIQSAQNVIGRKEPGKGNRIAGNQGAGIELWGRGAKENRIEGNQIGLEGAGNDIGVEIGGDAENNRIGSRELPNEITFSSGHGVRVDSGRYNVVEGNRIHDNDGSGVYQDRNARGAWVSANSIYDNGGPAIDVAPEHTEVWSRVPRVEVQRSENLVAAVEIEFVGEPNQEYTVEFFTVDSCAAGRAGMQGDPTRHRVTTNVNGVGNQVFPASDILRDEQAVSVAVLRLGQLTRVASTCSERDLHQSPNGVPLCSFGIAITGNGFVDSVTSDGSCVASACSFNFPCGVPLEFSPFAYSGSVFLRWEGGCNQTTPDCYVTPGIHSGIHAFFTESCSNSVTVTTVGSGEVTSANTSPLIACPSTSNCSGTAVCNAAVTLTATPSPGWTFSHWETTGDCSGQGAVCTLTANSNKSERAYFVIVPPCSLNVGVEPVGGGSVVDTGSLGINCTSSSCSHAVSCGTPVGLLARPTPWNGVDPWRYEFSDWTDACAGSASSQCNLTVNGALRAVAEFVPSDACHVSVTKTGQGTVKARRIGPFIDDLIDCGLNCAMEWYSCGEMILDATPAQGWRFGGWADGCFGTDPTCTVLADKYVPVHAIFLPGYRLFLTKYGGGSVSGGVTCDAACGYRVEYFAPGTVVDLVASNEGCAAFVNWTACDQLIPVSGQPPICRMTMNSDKDVEVTFSTSQYTLNVGKAGNGTGTISSTSPSFICTTSTCPSQSVACGSSVQLTAQPDSCSTLTAWSGCDSSTLGSPGTCNLSVNNNPESVTATFTLTSHTVTVNTVGEGDVTSSSTSPAINCPPNSTNCIGSVNCGATVQLTAAPRSGWAFERWDGDCTGSPAICTLPANGSKSTTAYFIRTEANLTVTKGGNGRCRVESISGSPGAIYCDNNCSLDSDTFTSGSVVLLRAFPDISSVFEDWSAPCSGQADCSVTMDRSWTVTAFCNLKRVELTVAKTGQGRVSSDGIDCGLDCTQTYDWGTTVTLSASADSGWYFSGWSGDAASCGSSPTCQVTLAGARTAVANFAGTDKNLTVVKGGSGSGRVYSGPGGIDCTAGCPSQSASFAHGTSVTLYPEASSSSVFEDWSGPCSGLATCVVTMDQARTITAFFRDDRQLLTVTREGQGSVSGPGIGCGTDCTELFDRNTSLNLTASPASGWRLESWSGACSGTGTCSVTMDTAKTVNANFVKETRNLSVSVVNPGGGAPQGSVSVSPPGSSCTSSCTYSPDYGTQVTLEATVPAGLTFAGWSGGSCSGTALSCTVTMDQARTVAATFTLNTYNLTVNLGGTGTGSVSGLGIACPGDCSETFNHGTSVTLTASASSSSAFEDWSGPCSGMSTCVVTMDQARTITAFFRDDRQLLTVTKDGEGSVTGSGISCGADCTELYNRGTVVGLSASPATGWRFVSWGGACSGSGSCSVTMDDAKLVTATFVKETRNLSVSVVNPGGGSPQGSVSVSPPGSSCTSSCTYSPDYGTQVTLEATVPAGLTFAGWSGGSCSGTALSCTVTMDQVRTVTATFTLNSYSLNVGLGGDGSGTVSGPGIACPGDCSETYNHGTLVNLTASADSDSVFEDWSAPCSGLSTCVVTMDQARTITAYFRDDRQLLTVTKDGEGTVSGPGINCGVDCTELYDRGTVVTLTQTPATGWRFVSWGGACSGSGGCSVTLDDAKLVNATFVRQIHDLNVSVANLGAIAPQGTVTVSPPGSTCTGNCPYSYDHGTLVTLEAVVPAGRSFIGWSGGSCSGTALSCTVTMDQARAVTATFTAKTYVLNVALGGDGNGTVAGPGISCQGDCTEEYLHGTLVNLVATPAPSSIFEDWSAPCSGLASCVLTMDEARTVTAFFRLRRHELTVSTTGSGSVLSVPAGIDCGLDCTELYVQNTTVTLTPTPAPGWQFDSWGGACTGSGACSVTMDAAKLVTATFTVLPRQLDVVVNNPAGVAVPGTVSVAPPGATCGDACSYTYDHGTSVTLTANVPFGLDFAGWGGACSGTASTCLVTLDAARSVTATFVRSRHTLAVATSGTGSGSIVSVPAGINCLGDCSENYDHGQVVTLTATPAVSSIFTGWSAPCLDQEPTPALQCTVTMTQAYDVTAFFELRRFELAVNVVGEGTVTSAPTGIFCGEDCTETYNYGTVVQLTPTPAPGHEFVGWSPACGDPCSVTLDGPKTLTATFRPLTRRLDVQVNNPAGWPTPGSVTVYPPGTSCNATCAYNYDHGALVTLSISEPVGLVFTGWGGACSGINETCNVTLDQARTVTATFVIDQQTLSVATTGTGSGTVVSSPSGINCLSDCSENYDYGRTVTLTATPAASSIFAGWSAPCLDQEPTPSPTCTVTMTQAYEITATFDLKRHELTVTKLGEGSVASAPAGIDCGLDCTQWYDHGTLVSLSATPAPGWEFAGWAGVCSGPGACLVTMNASKSVQARFTPQPRDLFVVKAGTGSGRVVSTPAGIDCGATCSAEYPYATLVTLTATADASSVFEDWSAPCSGQLTCVVNMNEARTVTAFFQLDRQLLTVTKTGEGTVTSSPAGINCGTDCTEYFNRGQVVALTATPATGWQFVSWGGACSGSGACSVTLDEARLVTATFTRQSFNLALAVVNPGGSAPRGLVSASPPGSSCQANCTYTHEYDTRVTLEAEVPAGLTFLGWSGGSCSGTALSCTVTMNQARTVTATFALNRYDLNVALDGDGDGTVTGAGIACPGDCSETYDHGTIVTLTATASSSSVFEDWSAPCSGLSACVLTMDQARNVTAFFRRDQRQLTVTTLGEGSVSSSPAGISCGTDCTELYDRGTVVALTATPAPGWSFDTWSGACTGSGACSVTLDEARLVAATFVRQSRELTVTVNNPGTVEAQGSVLVAPPGSSCGSNCTYNFPYESAVTLTAVAPAGRTFAGWGGACTGNASVCTVTMDQARAVTATFQPNQYELTVSLGGDGTGTVVTSGISCPGDCTETFPHGTRVTLTAVPAASSEFVDWSAPCSGMASCVVTVDQARTVTAFFRLRHQVLTVNKVGSGTVLSTPAGIDCGPECAEAFIQGTVVSLTATPAPGWRFDSWADACTGTGSCLVAMDAAKWVTATFKPLTRQLEVTVTNPAGVAIPGSVGIYPPGATCTSNCTYPFDQGAMVKLLANVAPAGLEFTGWGGACSGLDQVCMVLLDDAKSVSATYARKRHTLTITGSGTGDGTVVSQPAGINYPADPSETFEHGTLVTLTATPDPASTFGGWNAPCGGQATCQVTMDQAREMTAFFVLRELTLTVDKLGSGHGRVTSNPAGISCGADCLQSYPYETVITLTAQPTDNNSEFLGWSGACSGTGACTVTLTESTLVEANFGLKQRMLWVVPEGDAFGDVQSEPGGIDCGETCQGSFDHDTLVQLTATPVPGAAVTWVNCDYADGEVCYVRMGFNRIARPAFSWTSHNLTIEKQGAGQGTVRNVQGIDCGSDCQETYIHDTVVDLEAIAGANSVFVGWGGDCEEGEGNITSVVMNAAKTCTARFEPLVNQTFTLTLRQPSLIGIIVVEGTGLTCAEARCTFEFNEGQEITLRAMSADPSQAFENWSSVCQSRSATCVIRLHRDEAAEAIFIQSLFQDGFESGDLSSWN